MLVAIIFVAVSIALTVGEWFVYDKAIFWHSDREDPRNFPPPR